MIDVPFARTFDAKMRATCFGDNKHAPGVVWANLGSAAAPPNTAPHTPRLYYRTERGYWVKEIPK
jgi:hypothetical protein